MAFLKWDFDEKRYRYSFTDIERRMRFIKKQTQDSAEVVMNKLGKDIQHKANSINKRWYRQNGEPKEYRRAQERGRGDILHLVGYEYDANKNFLEVSYSPKITSEQHGEYGETEYSQIAGRGHEWGMHCGFEDTSLKTYRRNMGKAIAKRDAKATSAASKKISQHTKGMKSALSFGGYVDFIETGGSSWKNLGLFPTDRRIHPTHTREKVAKWVDTQLDSVRKEVIQVAFTKIKF